ncbi:MAG: tetratricopeptide repeat protein [Planctomycetota bacterium]
MSGKAKFRLLMLLALAGMCGYVGFLVFKERNPIPSLEAAERLYDKEAKALEQQGNHKDAAVKYDQACVLLENAKKRLDGPHGLELDVAKETAGKVFYLKAKAIRDKHFALAAAAGTPLADSTDSVTGEKFRSIMSIRDDNDRNEAAGLLRGAATHFLPKDFNVQLDALRLALMSNPIAWDQVDRYSRAILEIKPDDSRAKYMVAKIDFEQPDPTTHRPTLSEKRSLERIKNAAKLINEVRDDPKFPIWRTEFLRANIHHWLMKSYAGVREKEYLDELDELDKILLDDLNGAIARIRQGEGMKLLSSWDVEGVLGLHTMAADVALDEIRRKRIDPSVLPRVYEDTLAFCRKKFEKEDPSFPKPMLIGALLDLMCKGQTLLALNQPKEWQAGIELLRPQLKEQFNADRCDPYRVAQFAELLMRESQVEVKRGGDPKKSAELRVEAQKWLDDGLKYSKTHATGNFHLQMLPFNILAANICYFNNDSRATVTPFLTALQETRVPQAQATALVIEAAYDEREGRLEKAKEKLLRAIKIVDGDEDVRAHASLANIYMALGRPDDALVSLVQLQHIYAKYNDLTLQEKEWLGIFLRSPQDYYALTVIASLENARRNIANYFVKNPRAKRYPDEIVRENELRVKNLLAQELSSAATGPGFIARTSWIYHLSVTDRRAQAEELWQKLHSEFPDRVELLNLKVGLMEREAAQSESPERAKALLADIDRLILSFVKEYPDNQSARLYYATWLAHSRRPDQAMKYLKEIVDTTTITPELRRVAAAIVLTLNTDNSPAKIARHMPRDPQIDKALFNLSLNSEKQRADIRGALTRFETVGLTRVMQAEDIYATGDFAKAATAFADTLDFTNVKSLAEQGVLRSMMALAHQNPELALTTIRQITASFPDDPAVLLSYAYVFLVRDEIGSPNDDWEQRRNMGSALNVWEAHIDRNRMINPTATLMTRGEFWFRANRIDLALGQLQRALNVDRQNVDVLAACASMILDDPAREPRAELREYLDELKRLAPNSNRTKRILARAAESAQEWNKAADLYEQIVATAPFDRDAYLHLVTMLDVQGEPAKALKWAKAWRKQLPDDALAAAAEIRCLSHADQLKEAREVAQEFVQHVQTQAAKNVQTVKDPAARDKLIENARWTSQMILARGFLNGGALADAEAQLQALPKAYLNATAAKELLSEVYLKQKSWAKAQAVLESLNVANPNNLLAANNLAYVLAHHSKQPSRARDVLLGSLKSGPPTYNTRPPERLPVEFLNTLGSVYVELKRPEYGREMLETFKAAAQRYPNDPRIDLYMGYAFELMGENNRARDYYERSLKKSGHPGLSHSERTTMLTQASDLLEGVKAKINRVDP